MRWLRGVLLAGCAVLPMGVQAEVCCPDRCVPEGDKCVNIGTSRTSCHRIDCPAAPPRPPERRYPVPTGSGGPPIITTSRCCAENQLPGGSYTRTCRDAIKQCSAGNRLIATCKDRRGRDKRSALMNADRCKKIVNDNGQLKCLSRPDRPPMTC